MVQIAFSVPTGSYKNGTAVSTIMPTVIGGKGFRKLVVQSAIGGILPQVRCRRSGVRSLEYRCAVQVGKYFWPELEANASYYHGGINDGRNQVFLTPGLIVSRIKLRQDPKDRLGLVFGGGMQIATSHYHNHPHSKGIRAMCPDHPQQPSREA